jgi:hypothetical protein
VPENEFTITSDTPINELSHAGVKGMKWGVRNDKNSSSGSNSKRTHTSSDGTVTTTKTRGNKTTITSRNGNSKAKLTVKRNRGAKLVAKNESAKIKVIISNTANVAAGAMRVAAAFVPGMSVLNGVATAASLVGTVATLKK